MEKIFVADLETNADITSYFMVKSVALKMGSNKKNYMDFMLGDRTGEISAKKWDVPDEEVESARSYTVGEIIKVRAVVTEWNGMKQLKITRIRKTGAEDGINVKDYIKAAPEDGPEMFDFIYNQAANLGDEDLRKLCTSILDKNKAKLLYYPAASKNHHAEMCGLLWHVKRMLMSGIRLCEVYTNVNKDMVVAGVILHDMEKIREINSNEYGISDGYSFEGMMLGHIIQGVRELDKEMDALGFSEEKKIMMEHMILAHHYEPEYGSPKKPLFPEAEMLHYLDVLDAKMYDMEEALIGTAPGEFSDRVWTLDNRRIYKRQED